MRLDRVWTPYTTTCTAASRKPWPYRSEMYKRGLAPITVLPLAQAKLSEVSRRKSRALVILSLAKSAQRAYHNLSAPRHQAHDIEPRSKKVLRWASGGKFVFAKRAHNPGIKKDPFIFNAEEAEAGAIKQRFDDIIEGLEG